MRYSTGGLVQVCTDTSIILLAAGVQLKVVRGRGGECVCVCPNGCTYETDLLTLTKTTRIPPHHTAQWYT